MFVSVVCAARATVALTLERVDEQRVVRGGLLLGPIGAQQEGAQQQWHNPSSEQHGLETFLSGRVSHLVPFCSTCTSSTTLIRLAVSPPTPPHPFGRDVIQPALLLSSNPPSFSM